MSHRRLALLAVLLTGVGGLLAHFAGAHQEFAELDSHAEPLSWLPLAGASMVALGFSFVGARRPGRSTRWLLLLPIIAWVCQEGLELSLGAESAPLGAVLEPHFLTGLLIQLPFVGAIFVLLRLFVRAGVAIIRRLRALRVAPSVRAKASLPRPPQQDRPRPHPLARGSPPRAPPRLVLTG